MSELERLDLVQVFFVFNAELLQLLLIVEFNSKDRFFLFLSSLLLNKFLAENPGVGALRSLENRSDCLKA